MEEVRHPNVLVAVGDVERGQEKFVLFVIVHNHLQHLEDVESELPTQREFSEMVFLIVEVKKVVGAHFLYKKRLVQLFLLRNRFFLVKCLKDLTSILDRQPHKNKN